METNSFIFKLNFSLLLEKVQNKKSPTNMKLVHCLYRKYQRWRFYQEHPSGHCDLEKNTTITIHYKLINSNKRHFRISLDELSITKIL